jgi:hypothetical protein
MTLASVSQHLLRHSHHRNRAAVSENRKGNSGEPQRMWADPACPPPSTVPYTAAALAAITERTVPNRSQQ